MRDPTRSRPPRPRLDEHEIRALIDPEGGTIAARIFSDPDVYELEMERVFGRAWLLLGHEAQVPRYGDFVTAYMGEDPIVVVRQRDGGVVAWLNQCRHRGNLLCRADAGNARSFRCGYHGWCYDAGGRLVQVPHEDTGYYGELRKEHWGLVRVPRLERYKGLIFGSWDAEAPPIGEWLGDAAYYLDALIDRSAAGVELLALERWTTQGNWKWQAEQHAGDMYHTGVSHASALMALPEGLDERPPAEMFYGFAPDGYQFASPQGHGAGYWVRSQSPTGADLLQPPATQAWMERTSPARARARLGALRAEEIGTLHMTVFPNLSFVQPINYLRLWHPRGPHQTEVWSFVVVEADAPQEAKDGLVRSAVRLFGSTGIFEQDDVDNVAMCQRGVRGFMGRRTRLNVQMGRGRRKEHPELPGVVSNVNCEAAARRFYARWQAMLLDGGGT